MRGYSLDLKELWYKGKLRYKEVNKCTYINRQIYRERRMEEENKERDNRRQDKEEGGGRGRR